MLKFDGDLDAYGYGDITYKQNFSGLTEKQIQFFLNDFIEFTEFSD